MPDSDTLLVFMAATLALNVTPGPDMLYVIARTTSEGRRAGVASAFGIAGGILLHIAALALGITAVLAAVPLAYEVIKWAGAVYLIWLGLNAIRGARRERTRLVVAPASLKVVFSQGVLTSALNPKIALFFLAFLPQFVDSTKGDPITQLVALGLLFICSGTIVNLIVAFGVTRAVAWLGSRGDDVSRRSGLILRRITGAVFIALGARIALATR